MSKSSPADLAVAFRSLARREREAVDAAEGAAIADLRAVLTQAIGRAAAAVSAPADPTAIAAALEQAPPDQWDAATLDTVRDAATAAGRALREIAARGPDSDH